MSLHEIFAEFEKAKHWPEGVQVVGPERPAGDLPPPVIAWMPTAGVLKGARRIGGGPGDDGDIATREWTIAVDFWTDTLDELEVLVDRFHALAHDHLSKFGYAPAAEQWRTGKLVERGAVCLMSFHLRTSVKRTPMATRPLTAANFTPTIVEPTP